MPITPTIPQQSVVTAEESDATNAAVAAAASKATAFVAFHREALSCSEDAEDESVDTARVDENFEDDLVDRC